ncbi:MAG: PQQ-binding-like beta-propeller repeat protein [Bacteroidales bacterium]|nr:PQQ-binding-like beta-propeller repeat protein [Bacteroidales bacterium]
MKKIFFTAFILSVSLVNMCAQIEWRNDRTGIYAKETGLLKSWPKNGPEMLWYYDGLGDGHSSVAISNHKIYATGMIDQKGYLHVFDLNGNVLNKIEYGAEWTGGYDGTRATPTIHDGKIYIMSGLGDLICLDEKTLNVIWKRNILTDFDAKSPPAGISESPLVFGDKVIATPGGVMHNIVALDKNTGKLIWSGRGKDTVTSYCAPLYIGDLETPLVVTQTAEHIIGVEASTGKLLWSFENKNTNAIHGNTPIYADNMILVSSAGQGSTMLQLSDGGRRAEIAWTLPELDNVMGGIVKLGNYIYGSGAGGRNRAWYCVDWKTGKIQYSERESGLAVGVIISANGMLYCYSDKGEMALVRPTPEKFDIVSRFKVEKGTDQHFAHPSIYQGVLYVRHGDSLIAYKIK